MKSCIHLNKKKKKDKLGYMMVKLDMKKPYDRLEWGFIRAILSKIGFHIKWIEWVMNSISMMSYSILINGILEGKIQPIRGIRQGGILSPYIFILCTKHLGRELVKETENPINHLGIPTHRN